LVSIGPKFRKLRSKCLFLFGHCALRSFVFIHIPASFVITKIIFRVFRLTARLFLSSATQASNAPSDNLSCVLSVNLASRHHSGPPQLESLVRTCLVSPHYSLERAPGSAGAAVGV
jgi:hypothetical protein